MLEIYNNVENQEIVEFFYNIVIFFILFQLQLLGSLSSTTNIGEY